MGQQRLHGQKGVIPLFHLLQRTAVIQRKAADAGADQRGETAKIAAGFRHVPAKAAHIGAAAAEDTEFQRLFVQRLHLIDIDRPQRPFHLFMRSGILIQLAAVDAHAGDHRRELLLYADETIAQRLKIRDRRDFLRLQHLAPDIIAQRALPQGHRRDIFFIRIRKERKHLARLADEDEQYACRIGIQGPAVSDPFDMQDPAQTVHDIVRGHAGFLIDEQYSVHVQSPFPIIA